MRSILVAVVLLASTMAQAAGPSKLSLAAAKMKTNDVRTVIEKTRGDEGPCDMGYILKLQVRQATYDRRTNDMTYSWETVKTVGADKNGKIMEVCAE